MKKRDTLPLQISAQMSARMSALIISAKNLVLMFLIKLVLREIFKESPKENSSREILRKMREGNPKENSCRKFLRKCLRKNHKEKR